MKRLNMLIMLAAVVLMTSSAWSEGTNANFDGQNGGVTFTQMLARADIPETAKIIPQNVIAPEFFNPRIMSVMDAAIRSAIDHAETQRDALLKTALMELLTKATPQQKYEFVYGRTGVYRMPNFSVNKGVAQWVCEAITKTVCKTVCDPGCVQDCQDIIVDSCKWM